MMMMMLHSHTFLVLLFTVFIAGIVQSGPFTARRSRVRRQNMKVRINATEDTIVMKFLRPNADTKLEGYILGYGSSMFSKQFIQLPENGQPYETEIDAEPKYLIAVQPIPSNDVKKECTGKVEMEKPLHLVIGSVTPTSVLLSWGTLLKTPYEGNVMDDCLEDGHYTVRYRERNRKWNFQTCPTSDTVIDNLRPNTAYEFGVQPNSKDGSGGWSKPVIHNTSNGGKAVQNHLKKPVKPLMTVPQSSPISPGHALHNRTKGRVPPLRNIAPKTTIAPAPTARQDSLSTPGPIEPVVIKRLIADGEHHKGNALAKSVVWSKEKAGSSAVPRPSLPVNKRPNLVGKASDHDKPTDLKQREKESILKPFPAVTAKPKLERKLTTTSAPTFNSSHFDLFENSSIFSPMPASEVDAMGKKRYVAPHVIYKTDKKPDEPCSITSSLAYFPEEEGSDQNVTGPPRIPPSNLTVVTVEGCPSFVILDWQKSDNETREYDVVSTTKGPNGEEMSILTTTNQTHTAVENLIPESSYEFKVVPKNELGTGPSSDPVSFSTESADPRVSENVSGKNAIWTQFPFKADSYSECTGKMFVKRTWYRKFVGIQLCNSLRYKIYLSDSLNGKFYTIGDQTGYGEDHCQFVDSFLDGRTGSQMFADQLPSRPGYFRAMRQEPVNFGEIGGNSHVTYVGWYECGTPIPGKW
ncbi:target of Nesh-SH3-like isoform X4 [Genypterus blacodes]|uniref:target of Nesh-SH3-like isoform X4 n=1 Tax=Genypterus blacodes TaxID=154954 RepID=UPI003F777936